MLLLIIYVFILSCTLSFIIYLFCCRLSDNDSDVVVLSSNVDSDVSDLERFVYV